MPNRATESIPPTFAEVATIVAGGEPPHWLAPGLERVSAKLELGRRIEAAQPTRRKMKERLKLVENAALLLEHILAAKEFETHIFLFPDSEAIEYGAEFIADLRDVAERARKAGTSISSKGGNIRAWAGSGLSAQALCAGAIAEAWALTHEGERPKPRNPQAAKAADALWRASGGDVKGWGDNPTGWSHHFTKAAVPTAGNELKSLNRLLVDHRTNPSEPRKPIRPSLPAGWYDHPTGKSHSEDVIPSKTARQLLRRRRAENNKP
jgi:hypothetical protein